MWCRLFKNRSTRTAHVHACIGDWIIKRLKINVNFNWIFQNILFPHLEKKIAGASLRCTPAGLQLCEQLKGEHNFVPKPQTGFAPGLVAFALDFGSDLRKKCTASNCLQQQFLRVHREATPNTASVQLLFSPPGWFKAAHLTSRTVSRFVRSIWAHENN